MATRGNGTYGCRQARVRRPEVNRGALPQCPQHVVVFIIVTVAMAERTTRDALFVCSSSLWNSSRLA